MTTTTLTFDGAVQVAMNEARMQDLLRRHFSHHDVDLKIAACHLKRLRWRDGQRAVLQYELDVEEQDTTRTLCVTGTIHREKRANCIVRKLRKRADLTSEVSTTLQPLAPASAIASLNMVVQPFPYDRRLPGLPQLMNAVPLAVQASVHSWYGDSRCMFGDTEITCARYRAGLGAVLRYRIPLREAVDGASERVLFAKVYRNAEQARKAFQELRDLDYQCATLGVFCSKPIAWVPEYCVTLIEGARGTTLEDSLRAGQFEPNIHKAAQTIAQLNTGAIQLPRRHDALDQARCLQRSIERLEQACPNLQTPLRSLFLQLREYPQVPLAPTHRDLKVEHIFVAAREVTLIDCDSMAMADPVIDPAMLLARLAALGITGVLRSEAVEHVTREFTQAYFARVPSDWRSRLAHHYCGALLEIAVGYYGRNEPGWPRTIQAIVEESGRALQRI